jgi:hypothetical protein
MEYAFRNTLTRFLLVLGVLALLTGIVWAQGGTGELTGLVTDPSGAVVPNAEVKLTNAATGSSRTTVTTDSGIYRFSALPIVGTYTLETSPKGFKSTKVNAIVVTVGTTTTRDVHLELGASSEQVTVEAGQQLVQTEESAVSQLVDRRVWENMPLEARNANDFVNLLAGAVPEQIAGGTFRGAAVNGTRTGTGNFMVEGVDNNEQGQGGVSICGTACGQGGSNTSISPDAIQEYRVISHDFNAEYGKAGGFVTDTVLKGGTNQYHGSLFEYNRIQKLTANDWFSNNAGIRDHLVRNQFGGSIGGPIVKDKTFFYATFEDHRLRVSAPVSGTALTQQFYDFVNSGQLQQFVESDPNGVCNNQFFLDNFFGDGSSGSGGVAAPCSGALPGAGTVGPIFQQLRAKWPLAMPLVNSHIDCATDQSGACIAQGAYTGGLVAYPVPVYDTATESSITPIDQYRFSVKVDHKLGANDQLNGVYLFEDTKFKCNFCGSDTTFGVPEENPNRAQTAGFTWTHTFSPTILNQAKLGYVRRTANFFDPGSEGIPEFYTIDALVSGFGASTGIPQFFTENQFQYKDDLSITHGKHSFKMGAEYRRTRNGSSFHNDQFGHFTSWSVEDLLTDSVFTDQLDNAFGYGAYGFGGWYYAGASVNPTNGQVPDFYRGYRANEFGAYGQDDWRISPRLTVNLGLRWDYFGPPHNFKENIDSNYYFGTPVTPIPCHDSHGVVTACTNPFFPQNSDWYALEASAVPQVRNNDIWHKDTNNFAPRIGFSWDTLGNQKWVVRGGFGIFYDRLYNNVFENIRFNAPFFADETFGFFVSGVGAGPLKQPGLLTIPFTTNSGFIDPTLFPNGLPKPVPRHIDQNLATAYYEQYSFGMQHDLGHNYALELNYIGTLGRKLIGIVNRNTFDGRTAGIGLNTRPNPLFNNDNARGNYYGSNYNALTATLRKNFSNGLSFNANYTYAKALDELSDVFRTKNNAAISATDVQNIGFDYGPADFDVRHRLVASYNYDLPFMRTNRWLGGWSLNGIFSWNTGSPIGLFDSLGDPNRDGQRIDRPNFNYQVSSDQLSSIVGKEQVLPGATSNAYVYLDQGHFAPATCAPAQPWCNSNLGRNSIPGPMFTNWDFGISKAFKITEATKLRFDANFFDLFNHPNFQNPNGNVSDPTFGQSQLTYGDTGGHRVTQLALRFDF